MILGENPNLSEMQPFGCRAFVLFDDSDGDLSWVLEQVQVFHRVHCRWNFRSKAEHQGTSRSTWTASQEPLHITTQT